MLAVGLVSLLFIVAVSAGQSFYSVYMDSVLDSSTETIGLVTSLGQLATAVLMLGAPAVLTRWGHARSFVGAAIFLGLSIVPIALIAHWLSRRTERHRHRLPHGFWLDGAHAFSSGVGAPRLALSHVRRVNDDDGLWLGTRRFRRRFFHFRLGVDRILPNVRPADGLCRRDVLALLCA